MAEWEDTGVSFSGRRRTIGVLSASLLQLVRGVLHARVYKELPSGTLFRTPVDLVVPIPLVTTQPVPGLIGDL